jgi:peroxiredoxin
MSRLILLNILVLLLSCEVIIAQPFSLDVKIKNQPDNPVIIGSVRGDKFLPLDTIPIQIAEGTPVSKRLLFTFPDELDAGVYRLVFGQTTYSRVMGEPPQQLDFIFNHENISFETDFKAPNDSLLILNSEENRLWFSFLASDKKLKTAIEELEKEVDYYRNRLVDSGNMLAEKELNELRVKASEKANQFNQLQMERDMFISGIADEHKNLFAGKMIKCCREPFRDGYLSSEERREFVQKDYFRHVDFTDESLINSSVLTDKVFNFLVTFNQKGFTKEQREQAYIKAVDIIMELAGSRDDVAGEENPAGLMYEFILGYLVNGFEILKMDNVLSFINDNYAGGLCQTDEKTTLVRRLEYQKMKPGTVVPDFTLDDIKGNPVSLSKVIKDKALIIFWASWCDHCNELLPKIRSWFESANNADLSIIAISLDTSLTEWHKAVVRAGFETFYNLSDLREWDGEVTMNYNVYATPTMFLIDSNRNIIARPVTFYELTESVRL